MAQQGWSRGTNPHEPFNKRSGWSERVDSPNGGKPRVRVPNDDGRVERASRGNVTDERWGDGDNVGSRRGQFSGSLPVPFSNRGNSGGALDHARRRNEFSNARQGPGGDRVNISNRSQNFNVVQNNRGPVRRWEATIENRSVHQANFGRATGEHTNGSNEKDSRDSDRKKCSTWLATQSVVSALSEPRSWSRPQGNARGWDSDAPHSSSLAKGTTSNRDDQKSFVSPLTSTPANESIERTEPVPKDTSATFVHRETCRKADGGNSLDNEPNCTGGSFGGAIASEQGRQRGQLAATLESPGEPGGMGFAEKTPHGPHGTLMRGWGRNTRDETRKWGRSSSNASEKPTGWGTSVATLETPGETGGSGYGSKRPRTVPLGWGDTSRDRKSNWVCNSSHSCEGVKGWGSSVAVRETPDETRVPAERPHSEPSHSRGNKTNETSSSSYTSDKTRGRTGVAIQEVADDTRGSGPAAVTQLSIPTTAATKEADDERIVATTRLHNATNRSLGINVDEQSNPLSTSETARGRAASVNTQHSAATVATRVAAERKSNRDCENNTGKQRNSSSVSETATGWGTSVATAEPSGLRSTTPTTTVAQEAPDERRVAAKRPRSVLNRSWGNNNTRETINSNTSLKARGWGTSVTTQESLDATTVSGSFSRKPTFWGKNISDETSNRGRSSSDIDEKTMGWRTSIATVAVPTAMIPPSIGVKSTSQETSTRCRSSSNPVRGWEIPDEASSKVITPTPNAVNSTNDETSNMRGNSSNTSEAVGGWRTTSARSERWGTNPNRRRTLGWGKSNPLGPSADAPTQSWSHESIGFRTDLGGQKSGWRRTSGERRSWGLGGASIIDKVGCGACVNSAERSGGDHASNKTSQVTQSEFSRKRRIDQVDICPETGVTPQVQNLDASNSINASPSATAVPTVTPEDAYLEDTDSSSVSGGLNCRSRHYPKDPRCRRPETTFAAVDESMVGTERLPEPLLGKSAARGTTVPGKLLDEEALRVQHVETADQRKEGRKINDDGDCLVDSPSPQRHDDDDNDNNNNNSTSNKKDHGGRTHPGDMQTSSVEPIVCHTIGGNPIVCRGVSLPTDVVHIDEVEWATPEDNRRTSEKAFRPKFDRNSDPCGCQQDGSGELCCTDLSCVLFACQEECRQNCLAGPYCNNQRISQRKWKKVEVIDAGPKGRGLRITEPAKATDLIAEYVGVAVKKKALDRLFEEYSTESMLYIMALDNNVYIDARKRGGVARYINHSCEPNCAVHRWKVRGVSRTGVFALRDIEEGEELSFDYKWSRKRGRAPTKCHCYSRTCRGTLELSSELIDVPAKVSGDWKVPQNSESADDSIVNRTIKIYFPDWGEYFAADVSRFNKEDGRHLVIFKDDMEESWVDLSKEQWMILDEAAEHFVIAKKASLASSSVVKQDLNNNKEVKNYVCVSSYVKDILMKNIIGRCEQFYRCKISVAEVTDDPIDGVESTTEETDSKSTDNDFKMWKLTIICVDPSRAREFLATNANHIRKNSPRKASKIPNGTISSAHARRPEEFRPEVLSEEILVPSTCLDQLRNRVRDLRCQFRGVDFNFGGGQESGVYILTLESSTAAEITRATGVVWNEINAIGFQAKAEITASGVFKNVGFFAGQLPGSDGPLLLLRDVLSCQDREFLTDVRDSLIIGAFEEQFNCAVLLRVNDTQNDASWDDDEERMLDVFFGCDPRRVRHLWSCLRTLVKDLGRGVKLLDLGVDKEYISLLSQSPNSQPPDVGNDFFGFINKTLEIDVKRDEVLPMFLRIECGTSACNNPKNEDLRRRVQLAEDMIRLQVELFRDTSVRTRSWIFGRDWSHVEDTGTPLLLHCDSSKSKSHFQVRRLPSALNNISDSRSVAVVCVHLADIVESLGLDGTVAVHSCLILYRFLQQILQSSVVSNHFKLHDVAVSCLFLAVKAQKMTRWKRLNAVLAAAYSVFYPHAHLDEKSEEAAQFAKRVLLTEDEILKSLDYDVFWGGFDSIASAAIRYGRVAEPLVQNVLQHATMGPVIAAGPVLWLGLGPEHVFAAIAGMLSLDLQPLFEALTLDPKKVVHAVDIITKSIVDHESQQNRISQSNKRHRHSFFGGQKAMLSQVSHVQLACQKREEILLSHPSYGLMALRLHAFVASRTRRLKLLDSIAADVVTEILPYLERIEFESCVRLFVDKRVNDEFYCLFGEGSWQALAIARHFLGSVVRHCDETKSHHSQMTGYDHKCYGAAGGSAHTTSGRCMDGEEVINRPSAIETKAKPGVLRAVDINFGGSWECCESSVLGLSEGRETGGKLIPSVSIPRYCLVGAGLRWWIRNPWYPSSTGFFNDSFEVIKLEGDSKSELQQVRFIAKCTGGNEEVEENEVSRLQFPGLELAPGCSRKVPNFEAVTVRRWPSEKTEIREKKVGMSGMGSGFSPAALQEMQLLRQLHASVRSPQGHPNLILPVAVAIGSSSNETSPRQDTNKKKSKSDFERLILGSVNQEEIDGESGSMTDASYLVFQPLPFTMNRVLAAVRVARGRGNSGLDGSLVAPTLLQCWSRDILSALSHCHANHIVIRTISPEHVFVDQNGVLKLSGLAKAIVIHPDDRDRVVDPLEGAVGGEEIPCTDFSAPELLLGATRESRETDTWSVACLIAHLLLGKPLFSGRSRFSKARSILKVVGTPSSNNYPDAARFPYFDKSKPSPPKKYKRGVEKALRFIVGESRVGPYEDAVMLLDRMLHLDPWRRVSAEETLRDPYLAENRFHVDSEQRYVDDWMRLKKYVVSLEQASDPGEEELDQEGGDKRGDNCSITSAGHVQANKNTSKRDSHAKEMRRSEPQSSRSKQTAAIEEEEVGSQSSKKPGQVAVETAGMDDDDGDDLYDMDDLVLPSKQNKRPRTE